MAEQGEHQPSGEISRRQVLVAGATIGVGFLLPRLSSASLEEVTHTMEPKLLDVPQSLPEKVFTTDRVGISRRTHEEHLKLWQGYANKTNEIRKALAAMEVDPAKANQIFSEMRALKVNYAFAYGGFINHDVYFDTIGGQGGEATGRVGDLIRATYGSFERWAQEWKATGIAGRGWAYLGYDHNEGRVWTFIGDSQDTFPMWNHHLILAMDVYEHAYYLDFQTKRADYIEAWFKSVDWDAVNARIGKAK
jgi:superoxide dismutase, Fe-Mn family